MRPYPSCHRAMRRYDPVAAGQASGRRIIMKQLPSKSQQFIQDEALRAAQKCLGCRDLKEVRIVRLHLDGSGPNWSAVEFISPLPPMALREAIDAIAPLTQKWALPRE